MVRVRKSKLGIVNCLETIISVFSWKLGSIICRQLVTKHKKNVLLASKWHFSCLSKPKLGLKGERQMIWGLTIPEDFILREGGGQLFLLYQKTE